MEIELPNSGNGRNCFTCVRWKSGLCARRNIRTKKHDVCPMYIYRNSSKKIVQKNTKVCRSCHESLPFDCYTVGRDGDIRDVCESCRQAARKSKNQNDRKKHACMLFRESGLTTIEASMLTGIDHKRMCQIVTGKLSPNKSEFERITRYLK